MSAVRRSPGIFPVLAVLLLVVPLGVAGWWMYRPSPEAKVSEEQPDVVCNGRVDVEGHVIGLEPSVPGRVIKLADGLEEGQVVEAGKEILWLDDATAQHRLSQALSARSLSEVELALALQDEKRFPKQLEAREALVKAAAERVIGAEKMLEQRRVQGGVTPLGKAEMEAFQAQIRELQLFKVAQQAEYDDLQKLSPRMRVQAAEARLLAAKADVSLAEKAVSDCVLRAPARGMILRLQASVGGIISPGGYPTAVVFAPNVKPLIIRAEIEQEFLRRVQVGMKAIVQDENRLEGGKLNGKVKKLSNWVAQKRTVLLEPGEINDVRTVECTIELDPDADVKELKIGQRMRVRIQAK